MNRRTDYQTASPKAYQAMLGLEHHLKTCGLEPNLVHLVKLRVSQMNGCAYCIDMHWKDLRAGGESEQKLYELDAWREAPFYTDRERAALAWAEGLTNLHDGHVPDALYEAARRHFDERELADLTLAVATINAWNRFAIAFRSPAGTYQPQRHAAARVAAS